MTVSASPFVSVIMPVYNKGPYVARAINSVLAQDFQDFELIIVCDPCTDNSREEVKKFTDPRIRTFYRDEPGPGGYAARNLGIGKAKADWVCFLDADDEYYPNRLGEVVRALMMFPDMRLHTSLIEESNGKKNKQVHNDIVELGFSEYMRLCLDNKRPVQTNSITVQKNILGHSNWFPDGRARRSGDLYLWLYLLANVKSMVFSRIVTSCKNSDIVGVSQTACPSLTLNDELLEEVKPIIESSDYKLLKRIVNRLNTEAWREHGYFGYPVNGFVWKYWHFNMPDVFYFAKWLFILNLPKPIYNLALKFKRRFF